MSALYSTDEIIDRLRDLIQACDEVEANWEQGDLAAAVREMSGAAEEARVMLQNMRKWRKRRVK